MKNNPENAVRQFLSKHRNVDIVEVVIDTSVSKIKNRLPHSPDTIPYLNLWAWNIHRGKSFKDTLRKIAETNDLGFLSDIVDEKGSSTFDIAVTDIYPNWPDDLDQGDKKIIQLLQSAMMLLSEKTVFFFHHVDTWPPVDIRTGNGLDVS